ncbi:DUF6894 family protein [Methylobacterium sp. P31]
MVCTRRDAGCSLQNRPLGSGLAGRGLGLVQTGLPISRYYFDVLDGVLFMDDEGTEFPSAATARTETLQSLPETAKHRAGLEADREVSFTVRDEIGRPVFQAALTIATRWLADAT